MKFILVALLTFGVVSVACSTSPVPTLTPAAGVATPSAPAITTATQPTVSGTTFAIPNPKPTAVPTLESTTDMALTPAPGPTVAPASAPALQPTAVSTLGPTTTPTPAPTLVPATIPTLEPDSGPAPSLRFYVNGVRIDSPPWVETSPDIARSIVVSAIIAKARFLSIEPIVRETPHWGYVAEMVYRFQVSQYLKGAGPDGLVVNLSSGPKYQAFPDWLTMRGEEEARQLAEKWLYASLAMYDNQGDGILILRDVGLDQGYSFTHINTPIPGYGGYPVIGRTWLPEDKDSIYRIEFMRRKTPTIPLSEFNDLIDDFGLSWKNSTGSAST